MGAEWRHQFCFILFLNPVDMEELDLKITGLMDLGETVI